MALSSAELAEEFGTDTKTLRKFLRAHTSKESQPGQGGRYTFEKAEVVKLRKAWEKWSEGKVDKNEPKDAGSKKKVPTTKAKTRRSKKAAPPDEELLDEDLTDELEEPTEDDLDDLAELDESLDDIDSLLDDDEE